MKKISIVVPCYNEERNVRQMYDALVSVLLTLPYDYELLFIDNCSLDGTREIIRGICSADKRVRAIFNAKNFGQFNSPYYALCQTSGDCAICICCDFQDPVEIIPRLVAEWERGYRAVCGIKTSSRESGLMYFLRSVYYKVIKRLSRVEQIEHFTGFGLYDKSFIDIMRSLDDPTPFLRGIVAELGAPIKLVEYEQKKRRAGKSSNNLITLYDAAMLSVTTYTKFPVRSAVVTGGILCFSSFLLLLIFGIVFVISGGGPLYYVPTPIILAALMLTGVQLIFTGVIGEYILSINSRVIKRPLVIEAERINFD